MTAGAEAACGSAEQLKLLLDSGLSPDARIGEEPLLSVAAARHNNGDAVRLLAAAGANLDAEDARGATPVDAAAAAGAREGLEALLQCGANANGGRRREESPLHAAAGAGDAECCLRLLRHAASATKRDQHGDLAVHRACLRESADCAEALLAAAPDSVDEQGARGFTPLHIAANQGNAALFLRVLRHRPQLDIVDRQERTALDIVLAKQDSFIMEAMGRRLVNSVLRGGRGNARHLLCGEAGQQLLHTLHTIDNEYQHRCSAPPAVGGATSLLAHVQQPEKFDVAEFVELLAKACSEGLAEQIVQSKKTVRSIADYLFKHVFLTQNEPLLQDVLRLGMVWSAVVISIEARIVEIYERSVGERRDGIKGLVFRNCMSSSGRVSVRRLHKMVASITKLWQLQLDDDDVEEDESDANDGAAATTTKAKTECDEQLEAMKDPVESLAVWSVLTGRLRLAPYLLRQEDFDLIPQALLVAKILRSLGSRRDIEDVYANKASKMAVTCEGMAMQALRRIKDVDTSQNNMLTMELVMLPLETFGDYTILDLAAKGESSSFVTIDIVQEALDRLWYSDFFFVRKGLLVELVILCGFLPPLQLVVPTMLRRFRALTPDFLKLDAATGSSADDEDVGAARPSANKKPNPLTTDRAAEPLLQKRRADADAAGACGGFLVEMQRFYQIPCVKFRIHVAMHVTFVMLLSYIVVKDFGPIITPHEILCYLCLLGFLVEEINEMITSSKEETFKDYFMDGWNLIDLVAIFFGFLAFILRFNSDMLVRYWSLVLLTTTCLAYWVRLLFVSVVLESLGPKLKMMSLMVKKDFLPFLYILFVLMFGFGVTFQALLFPEGKPTHSSAKPLPGGKIFLQMFRNTFYAIVGDYGLDSITNACKFSDVFSDNVTESDGDEHSCKHPIGAVLVPDVFMVLYIVIMQILLLNVIVAMFSKTIDAINNESKAMWQFEKYDLVDEFNTRSALPPPLNTLSEVRNLAQYLLTKVSRSHQQHDKHAAQDSKTLHDIKVYLCALYYQALAFRNHRHNFNGVVLDEEDLDEGNKIIFSQVNDIREKMERLDKLEETVQKLDKLVKELKAVSLRGPSSINPKRQSIMAMAFADD